MKFTRMRAIIACTLLTGIISAPAFGQSYGLIARGDCPKAARAAHARPAPAPAAMSHAPAPSYRQVAELERYVAELQAQATVPNPREHPRTKRGRSLPRPF